MKNIPPIPQESEAQRLEREAEKRKRDLENLNEVYSDCLTELEGREASRGQLGRNDLLFLYRLGGSTYDTLIEEANEEISEENRNHRERLFQAACEKRNHSADLAIILGCRREQIANSPEEITEDTKAYIGDLVHRDDKENIMPIFSMLPNSVEHIYTKFPEGRILLDKDVVYGGKTSEAIEKEFRDQKCEINESLEFFLDEFIENTKQESVDVIRLSVANLGFPHGATREQIYHRAEELGLKVNIPPEIGPAMRLRDKDQPEGTYYLIGMKPIIGLFRRPGVFSVGCFDASVGRYDVGLRWLNVNSYDESDVWNADGVWAFVRE